MTPEQMIATLAAAYGSRISPEQAAVYQAMLTRICRHPEHAARTVEMLIQNEPRFPAVAVILQTYRSIRDHAPRPQLEAHDTGWRQAAQHLDDCMGDCGRKRPLSELMLHKGFCVECSTTTGRVSGEQSQRWGRPPVLRDMDAA